MNEASEEWQVIEFIYLENGDGGDGEVRDR